MSAMDYETAQAQAREDVIAVLDGNDEERRERLAEIAVWAVESGRRIARDGSAKAGARRVTASEPALDDAARDRARVLAHMLLQVRAAV